MARQGRAGSRWEAEGWREEGGLSVPYLSADGEQASLAVVEWAGRARGRWRRRAAAARVVMLVAQNEGLLD